MATRSRGKQKEFRQLLRPLARTIVFPDEIGVEYSEEEEELEHFATFEENAASKARWFRSQSGLDTLADDSGLEVDALGGAPGVASKRWSGVIGEESTVSAANIAILLRSLDGIADRGARFRTVLVLAFAENGSQRRSDLVSTGVTEGRILAEPMGNHGFGYDPVFWSNDLGTSFGEASAAAKGRVSHRARAVQALVELLAK